MLFVSHSYKETNPESDDLYYGQNKKVNNCSNEELADAKLNS